MGRLPKPSAVIQAYKPINTAEIELAVSRLFDIRRHVIIPNLSYGFHGGHEKDIFAISSSNYGKEVEIKISVSDFRADFKKSHHHESKYVKEFYYAFPIEIYEKVKDEVPLHAGVIICERNKYSVYAKIIKKAKINTKAIKLTDKDMITIGRLASMRIWSLKNTIEGQKQQLAELRNIEKTKTVDMSI